ncbi:hypothetical protein TWF569_004264 [Orbilia oligospora]|uniref:Sulfate transporter family protein n=1 Tax=Orbilia oligospora TaxID=2813651 RepID=A0A7C8J0T4_ORBOL|nr:hypothetical protein TWF706_005665 [Orbilia oligospora]KAF3080859.1 hypothetical protein TWF103_003982 [Orbilia oligospora]KAF3080860.1 hypothetical protein TWF103_003982 [Orbilia oligospora]KAF3080906.1 hypothetical protein TWF102_002050 [Orbilia oligospora]KAF3119277.1 hypothetical protein TWF569_004264 [Orbilia oligospora]
MSRPDPYSVDAGQETRSRSPLSRSIGHTRGRALNVPSENRPQSYTSPHRMKDYERPSVRSYFHGSWYPHQPSPDQQTWTAYGSERIRAQTAELASLAISTTPSHEIGADYREGNNTLRSGGGFPSIDRVSSTDSPILVKSHLPRASNTRQEPFVEDGGLCPPEDYSRSPGPSHLTRLLRNPPPAETAVSSMNGMERNNDLRQDEIATERDSLLQTKILDHIPPSYNSSSPNEVEAQTSSAAGGKIGSLRNANICSLAIKLSSAKHWNRRVIWTNAVVAPISALPAVALALLLNLLDGLSYGIILFPLGEAVFSDLAPDGLSIFFVSTIVSQLVYSCGLSRFNAVGSEMIEVVPFFHKMAFTILSQVGQDKRAVISTTIFCMALSSVLTGVVFFLLGYLKLGSLIGFVPRHILVGCIGGVGAFLVLTGIETAARLEGSLEYTFDTLKVLFSLPTFFMWVLPLAISVFLLVLLQFLKHPFTVPAFFLSILASFYLLIAAIPALTIEGLRDGGWIFNAPKSNVPFWHFYTLYDFRAIHWEVVLENIPTMMALTFFGILHVPINVPSLGMTLGLENVDVDRELIAHGVSNCLSGLVGSIQNYLVYANSVLFIRSGGDSRLAGIMLALATTAIWMAGPGIIGYIPVFVVASLIFLLGIELLRESLYDTWRKLHKFEYLTVFITAVTMGLYDFVVGILVGIILTSLAFVIQASQKPAIRAAYSGARSTVRRHPFQQRFLNQVGPQIYLYKLGGFIFFGTISSVENSILDLLEERNFNERPIRFLVLDLTGVNGIDFSAAEAFMRIRRMLEKRDIFLVLTGPNGDVNAALEGVGIWDGGEEGVKLFSELNDGLQWSENFLLEAYYASKDQVSSRTTHLEVPSRPRAEVENVMNNSPRISQLRAAAKMREREESVSKWSSFKQPLPLILQTFQERTAENEDFWFRIIDFFERKEFLKGAVLFSQGEAASEFYLIQEGLLKASYNHQTGRYYESITAGTTCGELPFFSETPRTATVVAERDCVTWAMNREQWAQLQEQHPDVGRELYRLALKLTTERMESITTYILTRSS